MIKAIIELLPPVPWDHRLNGRRPNVEVRHQNSTKKMDENGVFSLDTSLIVWVEKHQAGIMFASKN